MYKKKTKIHHDYRKEDEVMDSSTVERDKAQFAEVVKCTY